MGSQLIWKKEKKTATVLYAEMFFGFFKVYKSSRSRHQWSHISGLHLHKVYEAFRSKYIMSSIRRFTLLQRSKLNHKFHNTIKYKIFRKGGKLQQSQLNDLLLPLTLSTSNTKVYITTNLSFSQEQVKVPIRSCSTSVFSKRGKIQLI